MILPRPGPHSLLNAGDSRLIYNQITDIIEHSFEVGEKIELLGNDNHYHYDKVVDDKVVASKGLKRINYGLIHFYRSVKKDLPIITLDSDGKYYPCQWLLSGTMIEGVRNIDILAEALARNGSMIPQDNEHGIRLKEIIKVSNEMIIKVDGIPGIEKELENAYQLIDFALTKFNTAIEFLMPKI